MLSDFLQQFLVDRQRLALVADTYTDAEDFGGDITVRSAQMCGATRAENSRPGFGRDVALAGHLGVDATGRFDRRRGRGVSMTKDGPRDGCNGDERTPDALRIAEDYGENQLEQIDAEDETK